MINKICRRYYGKNGDGGGDNQSIGFVASRHIIVLCFIRIYVKNVVVMQVIIRRIENVLFGEVDGYELPLTVFLADQ